MRSIPAAVFAFVAVLSSAACALRPLTDPAPIVVAIVNPISSIQAGSAPVTLSARIRNDSTHKGLGWTLTFNGVGCSPGCGTLTPAPPPSLTAVYQPPSPAAAAFPSAVITVTSIADPLDSDSITISIQQPTAITIQITNKFAAQSIGGVAVSVNATVLNDTKDAGVSWTLTANGADCTPACGTLMPVGAPSFAASYTPPASVPASPNNNPTITATSVTDGTKSDSFAFLIENGSADALALLKGQYAILLRGFDANELPMSMVGTITADGAGNVTAGEFDIDDDGGITPVPAPLLGNYTIQTSFNNAARGQINITNYTFPNSTTTISFSFALSSDGTRGSIVEFDDSGYKNAGTLQMQDPGAVAAGEPTGSFAFGLDSDAPVSGRTVAAGEFSIGAGGQISGGLIDQSHAGAPLPTFQGASITSGSVGPPDTLGRGTLSLTVSSTTSTYAYYIVNSSSLLLVQTDAGLTFGTVQAGKAFARQPMTADSINMNSVVQMTGMDTPHGSNAVFPTVMIGVMNISNASTVGLQFDTNDQGSVGVGEHTAGTVTSFDPSTGRAVISTPGGFNLGFVETATIYLYDSGKGFLVDMDPSSNNFITNDAFSGSLAPQATGPFSNESVSGNTIVLAGASANPLVPNVAGVLNASPSTSSFSAIGNFTSDDNQAGKQSDVAFNGDYAVDGPTIGHGSGTVPASLFGNFSPNQTASASFFIIGENQIVLMGTTPGQSTGIVFLQPD